jgi:sec-independent protein translocase protein TatA
MGKLGTPELLIILLLLIVLFGGKRLPDAARGLGRSLRIFKSEIKSDDKDETPDQKA